MTSTDRSRFDRFRDLFTGNPADNRHRLFLSTLWDASSDKSNPSFSGRLPDQFRGIEAELVAFIDDVIEYINNNRVIIDGKVAAIVTTPSAGSERELNNFVRATMERILSACIGGTGITGMRCSTVLNLPVTVSSITPSVSDPFRGKTEFSYKLTSYLLESLLENVSPTTPVSTDLSSLMGSAPSDTSVSCEYYRKIDEPDKLFARIGGVETEVSLSGSYVATAWRAGENATCKRLGYEGANCLNFLKDCVISGGNKENIAKCKTHLTDVQWKDMKEEVRNVVPDEAVLLLTKFGFQREQVTNEHGRNLNTMESYDSWIARLGERSKTLPAVVTDVEVTNIASNIKLVAYLKLLVEKINSCPTILNPDVDAGCNVPDRYFKHTSLSKIGISPNRKLYISNVVRLGNILKRNTDKVRLLLSHPLSLGGSVFRVPYPHIMVGGGDSSYESSAGLFKDLFQSHIEHLDSIGKKLDASQIQMIDNAISKLAKDESNLLKVMKYLERYFEIAGDYNDPDKVLSVEHIKALVEKGNKSVGKIDGKNQKLVDLLTQLIAAISE